MSETEILGGRLDRPEHPASAEMTLRLLARWLVHCHERVRQRRQLGVLEPRLRDDVAAARSGMQEETDKPFWR